jgi:nucleoside-triphosphatase THEP1
MLTDLIRKASDTEALLVVDEPQQVVETKVAPKVAPKSVRKTKEPQNLFVSDFNRPLRKVEMWFSNPGVGKTTLFRKLGNSWLNNGTIDDFIVVNCHEDLNVQSLFKTTTTQGSDFVFLFNNLFNAITDNMQKQYLIVFDEFNLLPMSVQKGLQPILDDTIGDFDFENNTFTKNPNINYIITLNHKDIGVNRIADAIIDRVYPVFFKDLSQENVAIRTQFPIDFIRLLERVYNMFAPYGDIDTFHKSVRQLNNLHGLSREQFKEYIISKLEFGGIEWEQVISLSPEFENILDEYENIQKGGK